MNEITVLYSNTIAGDADAVVENIQSALDANINPEKILNEGMIAAMQEVGRLFEEGEYFVPEMLIAGRAMQAGLNLLRPHLLDSEVGKVGKVVIGTVQGDLHDIGKNLVGLMLEGAGFDVIDLGTDVTPDQFVEAAKENDAKLVGLSALLTTTMPNMEKTVDAFRAAGMADTVNIMVGGAPVTQEYTDKIGADGFGQDASRAVSVAKDLLSRFED
ncbi:MAG: cobalamin-binding protein [Chloroflexi bacterium]|nr:cobalamin-binding protein [Chloroflexota bacterium]